MITFKVGETWKFCDNFFLIYNIEKQDNIITLEALDFDGLVKIWYQRVWSNTHKDYLDIISYSRLNTWYYLSMEFWEKNDARRKEIIERIS